MKKKMKLWEKIFVIANITIILIIIGIYAYRAIYYYKKTNTIPKDNKLLTVLLNVNNITFKDDGLYQTDTDYYYKGENVNNYLYYAGRMWRIINIDDNGIKLITDDNQTSLVWGFGSNYKESYINTWLNNNFLNSISDYENQLVKSDWCNQEIDINNYNCDETTQAYVGLLSTKEYLKSNGKEGFLNNNSYWWTLNTSNNEAIYIYNEGGINNKSKDNDTYYSYGVRPSIILKRDITYKGGNGTKENPYIIDQNQNIEIGKHSPGNYLVFNNYKWRIMETGDEYTKIIMDGYIKNNDDYVKSNYNKLDNYLKNTFLKSFNTNELEYCDFYKNTYNYNYKYDYNNNGKVKTTGYIGTPIVGDLFTTDYSDYWLDSKLDNTNRLVYIQSDNSIFADLMSNTHYIRPIICIKSNLIIKEGLGTKDNPLLVGDNNENNN